MVCGFHFGALNLDLSPFHWEIPGSFPSCHLVATHGSFGFRWWLWWQWLPAKRGGNCLLGVSWKLFRSKIYLFAIERCNGWLRLAGSVILWRHPVIGAGTRTWDAAATTHTAPNVFALPCSTPPATISKEIWGPKATISLMMDKHYVATELA